MPNTDLTIFVGLNESELLTLRSNAVAQLTSTNGAAPGQVITSVSTRDLSVSYGAAGGNGAMSPDQIVKACTYALQKLNSSLYGTDLIHKRVKWSA